MKFVLKMLASIIWSWSCSLIIAFGLMTMTVTIIAGLYNIRPLSLIAGTNTEQIGNLTPLTIGYLPKFFLAAFTTFTIGFIVLIIQAFITVAKTVLHRSKFNSYIRKSKGGLVRCQLKPISS